MALAPKNTAEKQQYRLSHKDKGKLKYPVGFPVLPLSNALGGHLGDGRRSPLVEKTNKNIDGVGRLVIAHTLSNNYLPEIKSQHHDLDQQACNTKNRSPFQNVFLLIYLMLSRFRF